MKRIVLLTLVMLIISVCLIGCANHPSAGSQTSDTENQATVSDTENNETVITTDYNDTCSDTSEDTSNETLQNSCKYNLNYNDICGYYFHKIDRFYFNRGVYNCFSKMNASDIGDRPETKAQWELEYYNAVYNDSQKPCDRMFVTTLHFIRDYSISKDRFIELTSVGGVPIFSHEQYEALYSDDISEYYREFKNPCTIQVDDVVYTPDMLEGLSLDEMKELGISENDIKNQMDTWEIHFLGTTFYDHMVKICRENNIDFPSYYTYEEKLINPDHLSNLKERRNLTEYEDDYTIFFADD